LIIAAKQMAEEGYGFYRSDLGVWLTEHVPVSYIQLAKE
jgi:RNA:NAD 2'-phosphotransferase (TPT1/KptA family)